MQEIQNWMKEKKIVAKTQDDYDSDGGESSVSTQSSSSRKRGRKPNSNTPTTKVKKPKQIIKLKTNKSFLKEPNETKTQKDKEKDASDMPNEPIQG